ncbi:dTDP-4-dehydrorhamnose reductase [Dokdonia sinensis]|uniref:dTDP-4-dehydrorhamnose reductase n=1 Tax=Dokdonia sinensis TaxID=2479847 RepID=A0A3M0G9A8_9FLAO|nr:dTDP-4-dehydrorhamnose reductase [Dokdonia sinensis]
MGNIVVLGAGGQLGQEFQAIASLYTSFEFVFVERAKLDLVNATALEEFFKVNDCDYIINCAAYTNVDKAEDEGPKANLINTVAVRNLASICAQKDIGLIHISTDYVFNGKGEKPYKTDFPTEPLGNYGRSKRKGEEAIMEIHPENSLIIRTSWLYSEFGHNFVKTMLRLGEELNSISVVEDQVGSPTYARDLAMAILEMIPQMKDGKTGIYHYANNGEVSWYAFAKAILKTTHPNCSVQPVPSSAYPTKVKRPKYSVLDTTKTETDFKITIRLWDVALQEALSRIQS